MLCIDSDPCVGRSARQLKGSQLTGTVLSSGATKAPQMTESHFPWALLLGTTSDSLISAVLGLGSQLKWRHDRSSAK